MANIKNLQMWNCICSDASIGIKKTMFGLFSTVIYTPTGSPVNAVQLEYSHADGNRLNHILSASPEEQAKLMADFRPEPQLNGNYMAEVCHSRDGVFLAVRLYQFSQMNYVPVSDVAVFEGELARTAREMFLRKG